ncbi:hypothetical protein [Caldicoprobacter faecalis]|uniref:Uncharacterized protein n=1 Tax=Caldicoprobacter faecalis TaxID=937334 RepID=A0A1I5WUW0_9FIRM|nr:hypothetical protein [Caldicoprobacter faecalis]SFQ23480.1 hypothetical protein SAMN05444406_11944 [Caldicoprobacter faecalis]
MPVQDADITLKLAFIQAILRDKEFSDIQKMNIAKKILQEKQNFKEVNSMINIEKVVTYKNLSSDDLRFFLRAGYEPVRDRVLKLTDGYFVFDEDVDDYVLISR